MELVNISELDLNGLLFVHFPDDMTLGECRERLELMVYEAWEEDNEGCASEEERTTLAMTPYLVFRALVAKRISEYRRMPTERRRKCLDWRWKERESQVNLKIGQKVQKRQTGESENGADIRIHRQG